MPQTRITARRLYADAVEAQGPKWANLANSVRAGFENMWIIPALDALEQALREGPDDEEDAG